MYCRACLVAEPTERLEHHLVAYHIPLSEIKPVVLALHLMHRRLSRPIQPLVPVEDQKGRVERNTNHLLNVLPL